jgi:hypothetical protein
VADAGQGLGQPLQRQVLAAGQRVAEHVRGNARRLPECGTRRELQDQLLQRVAIVASLRRADPGLGNAQATAQVQRDPIQRDPKDRRPTGLVAAQATAVLKSLFSLAKTSPPVIIDKCGKRK